MKRLVRNEIPDVKGILLFFPYNMPNLSSESIHDIINDVMCDLLVDLRTNNMADLCQMHLTYVHTHM
jgi:hypothetical protein